MSYGNNFMIVSDRQVIRNVVDRFKREMSKYVYLIML